MSKTGDGQVSRSCKFCRDLLDTPKNLRQTYNRPLLETENFLVVPSLGSLVVGWVMVVPKQHMLSCASLEAEHLRELDGLNEVVVRLIENVFRVTPIIFEHGPSIYGEKFGCGVDHAHMHYVPINIDPDDFDLENFESLGSQRSLPENLKAISQDRGYLFIRFPKLGGFYCHPRLAESQFFRKIIASKIGMADEFDYNDFPFLENVNATTARLHEALNYHEPTHVAAI